MINKWMKEIKAVCDPEELGMILVHNGIVRGTSKEGKPVRGMRLSYDGQILSACVEEMQVREGIAAIRVWINQGELAVGDDIMFLLVAGRFRTDVMPVLQELLARVKNEVVREEEVSA
jgi:molybdopterin synthase catalytic subunit